MAEMLELDYIFHPRSIAVAGASSNIVNPGGMLLGPLLNSGFEGKVYPVHPRESKVMGLECYPNVKDIPEPVDYVIVCIPARFTPQLVEDCVAKGVKVASFFTAGFSESGEEEGRRLEAEIVQIARRGGVRLVGPNCMGIYCPSTGLSFDPSLPRQSGPVGFLCQSGGNAMYGITAAASRGVYFSKAVSYGNACDLNESDFLEYFAQDPETKIIISYIEGAKDGQQLFRTLNEATKTKPVIILKGGRTDAGATTAASHTGALASSEGTWDALFKQAGAIQVYSLEELIDVALLFLYMKPPKGHNAGIIGIGGGASVLAADDCASAGLSIPSLPKEIRERLKGLTTSAGNIFNNPIDTQSVMIGVEEFSQTIRVVAEWEGIDFLIMQLAHVDTLTQAGMNTLFLEVMLNTAKTYAKPTVFVLHSVSSVKSWQILFNEQQRCLEAGFPVFYSLSAAANAISRFLQYHGR